MARDEGLGFFQHQIGKIASGKTHAFVIFPQIMPAGSRPIKKMRVVIDAPAHVPERRIKPLRVWHEFRRIPQVPLARVPRRIAGGLEHLRHREFVIADADFGLGSQRPKDANAHRIASSQQRRSRRAANGLAHIEVCEARAFAGHAIDVGRGDLPAEAMHVGVALVIAQNHNDIGRRW